jgi:beta-N-acetylhexosaminidase
MLIIGFSGYEIDDNSQVVDWLQRDGLGGVLLFDYDLPLQKFGKNLKNIDQIKRLTRDLNHYSTLYNNALPLLIALDYEGGAVDRLAKISDCIKTLSAHTQAQLSQYEFVREIQSMAKTLADLGFNLNFAPVVDLNLNDKEGIIGRLHRSFSEDPQIVAEKARQFVQIFHQQGISCAYKHFPGHGSAFGDTHEGCVDVTARYDERELLPYRLLCHDESLPAMVMTAHVVNRTLDASGMPATLSYSILTQLLRERIGFNGIIISDDLQMQAISHHYSLDDSLRLTINAGADMIIFGNQLGAITATEVIDRIEALVKSCDINPAKIDAAYERIVKFKKLLYFARSQNAVF